MRDDELWSEKSELWNKRIGADGDRNRRLNSDPVLWRMVGDPKGLRVLDAGCGTGYLSIQLAGKGAHVTAVDYADGMVAHSRRNIEQTQFKIRVEQDSCSTLGSLADGTFDLIVSNYVLMDLPDLEGAIRNFARVLKNSGRVVAVISHPCFDTKDGPLSDDSSPAIYRWDKPYFKQWDETASWGEFTTHFRFYHRSLSEYWRTFRRHGFVIVDMEEPVATPPYPDEMTADQKRRAAYCPFSIAFEMSKA